MTITYRLVLKLPVLYPKNTVSVAAIKKESINLEKSGIFQYYYTSVPSQVIENTRPWDNTKSYETVNKDGLNERFDYDTTKPINTLRIVTLGDSFTWGLFVNTEDNWTEILENKLNDQPTCPNADKTEVINVGMHGFDVPYLTKRYKEVGDKYSPDVIIWFESGTGFTRYLEKMRPYIDICENEVASGQYVEKSYYDCWKRASKELQINFGLDNIRKEIDQYMNDFLVSRGNTLTIFATFENIPETDKEILQKYATKYDQVYFTGSVPNISKDGIFPDNHPNQKGHALIAQNIYNYLKGSSVSTLFCNLSDSQP